MCFGKRRLSMTPSLLTLISVITFLSSILVLLVSFYCLHFSRVIPILQLGALLINFPFICCSSGCHKRCPRKTTYLTKVLIVRNYTLKAELSWRKASSFLPMHHKQFKIKPYFCSHMACRSQKTLFEILVFPRT